MSELIASSKMTAIVGTGVSGLSAARFLQARGERFVLFDTRERPPAREQIAREFPDVGCEFGPLDGSMLASASEIILSPGLSRHEAAISEAAEAGVPVVGDVEVFTRYVQAPIVAITGSNAKSTVTTLVGEMAKAAGKNVAVGGNLGTPVLDLLDDDVELYVLELSSFQLETVTRLGAEVASILNMSPDHLDRYPNMMAYHAAKQRIYFGASHVVVNRQDPLTHPPLADDVKRLSFGSGADFGQMGTMDNEGELWLTEDLTPLIPASELRIPGKHNIDNALAALAIGKAAGLPMIAMLEALRQFKGLPHRCEPVADLDGVLYVNDSKGTNIGATVAAIEGLAREPAKLVVLLGGTAKDDDFRSLVEPLRRHARAVIVFGRDGELIQKALPEQVHCERVADMAEAVSRAGALAQSGDAVLLSPACASFDQYANYLERGDHFRRCVEEVAGG